MRPASKCSPPSRKGATMAREMHAGSRLCCDGGCQNGGTCPAFAPGVISGPHARRQRMRNSTKALTWLMALAGVVVLLAPVWVRWL